MVGRMDVTRSRPGGGPKVDTAGRPVLHDEWRIVDLLTSDDLAPRPIEFALRHGTPGTIDGWKALADSLLANQSCVFHRNLEISSCYAWMYKLLPECFKWAGDGGVRVPPRPARPPAVPPGYGSHRLRGHPARDWIVADPT